MPNLHIAVHFSTQRDSSGLLNVHRLPENEVIASFDALGRGSQGPGDTQLQTNGNTPTGRYRVERLESTGAWNQSAYGPHGALRLQPLDGNAAASGRSGLLVHGGDPVAADSLSASFRPIGGLRPTYGCIRVSNEDMRRLVQLLFDESLNRQAHRSEPIDITLSVDETPVCLGRGA